MKQKISDSKNEIVNSNDHETKIKYQFDTNHTTCNQSMIKIDKNEDVNQLNDNAKYINEQSVQNYTESINDNLLKDSINYIQINNKDI